MKKILFFDYDDTLSYNSTPICSELIFELKRISNIHKVCIATGRNSHYMIGVFRQIGGLENISLIAENGSYIAFHTTCPPTIHTTLDTKSDDLILIDKIKKALIEKFGRENLWFAPNETTLTLSPSGKFTVEEIYNFVLNIAKDKLITHKHRNSVDIMPKNVNKANGIKKFFDIRELDLNDFETFAFGDSLNDIEMFDLLDNAFVIGDKIEYKGTHSYFSGKEELIDYLKNNF